MSDIASICQRHVITIGGDATLQDAALRMREHHVGALVVTAAREGAQQVTGVLTDRDLAIEALARCGDAAHLRVSDLALGAPVSVPADASLAHAVERMSAAGVRRLLVHDAEGHLVGLVSFDDLLPACLAPLSGLAEALRRGLDREASLRGQIAAPARPALRVPAMGTAGWPML
jgi:CBS domain-containing protein